MQVDIINLTALLASPTASAAPRVVESSSAETFDLFIKQCASPEPPSSGIDTSSDEITSPYVLSTAGAEEDVEIVSLEQIEIQVIGSGDIALPVLQNVAPPLNSREVTLQVALEPIAPREGAAHEYHEAQALDADVLVANTRERTVSSPKRAADPVGAVLEFRDAIPNSISSVSRSTKTFNQTSGEVDMGCISMAPSPSPITADSADSADSAEVIVKDGQASVEEPPKVDTMQRSNNTGTAKGEVGKDFMSSAPRLGHADRFQKDDSQARHIPPPTFEKSPSRESISKKELQISNNPVEVSGKPENWSDSSEAGFNPASPLEADLVAANASVHRIISPHLNHIEPQYQVPRIAKQILSHIQKNTGDRTSLELSPDELGIVRFNISQGERVSIQVIVERPETLELIRRHIDLFQKELHDMGFGNSEFTFTDNRRPPNPQGLEKELNVTASDDDPRSINYKPVPRTQIIATNRLDLKL